MEFPMNITGRVRGERQNQKRYVRLRSRKRTFSLCGRLVLSCPAVKMEIIMSPHLPQKGLYIERFGNTAVTAASALICMFPLSAFAANPIEELAKQKDAVGGGIDPHGDSWLSMQHSLEQFLHPEFMLRLFLNLLLAVACAWVIALHPRSSRIASLSDLEERKTLLPLGMVG